MQINNISVVERHNRPGVLQKVALRSFFINDGQYQDPYEISSVSIFKLTSNTSPSTILNSDNLISNTLASSVILMNFANSATLTTNSAFNASNYNPPAGNLNASGIYKVAAGQYAVVLDGTINLSGVYGGSVIANQASTVTNYIDVWTVKMVAGSEYAVYINEFKLYDDTFYTITEPLLLETTNKLRNKYVKLGSKVDLTISTEFMLGNKTIDSAVKNIFRDSVLVNPSIQIVKLNDDYTLPARVTVSSFANTSATTEVTSDNTILFNWDTNSLYTLPAVLNGTFGSLTGAYQIQVKYNVLNQTILSDYLNLIVN
jgi:hypothetical protein